MASAASLVAGAESQRSRAVVAGVIGNVLEWFDFGVYGYFVSTISQLFFPSDDPLASLLLTFAVFGVGFVMRPVGSILVQLARRLTALTVIATVSRPQTRDWCLKLGAHHVIDHTKPIPGQLKSIGHERVALIAGLTNTQDHLPAIIEVIAPQGRFALIDDPKVLDINPFKGKSVSVHWESMFTRSSFKTPDMIAQHNLLNEVSAMVDDGRIVTTMAKELSPISAANLREAHGLIESSRSIGKVVLQGW